MKKVLIFVALLMSVANLTQADMLVSIKDSVATTIDSAESEILHFSNAEISRIIKDSESLNPQIDDLGTIKTTDTVVLKINDSLVYSFSPSRGESCWKRLKTGVNKQDLKLINLNFFSFERKFEEKDVVLSLAFIDKIHSNLKKNLPIVTTLDSTLVREESVVMIDSNLNEKKSVVFIDSNLFKKESFVSTETNSPKKVSIVKKRTKKIFVLNKKESEAIAFRDSTKASVLDSLKKESIKKEGVFDTTEVKKYRSRSKYIETMADQGENDHENFVMLKNLVIGIGIFFLVIYYLATKEKRRIKKEARKAREEYEDSMNNN